MAAPASDQVIVFDTTLRDGELCPGVDMNLAEKLEVAQALVDLGVNVIEAGFPAASPADFEAVQAVARRIHGVTVCGLARCRAEDISKAWQALKEAPSHRLHVFIATSRVHREQRLRMSSNEVVSAAVDGVKRARALCPDVEFSAEDASRTERELLVEVLERAIEAGATTVNIADTVGWAVPAELAATVAHVRKHVRGIDGVVLSVHCHDDLGMAAASSLAALREGARQVECTVNGLGERAGNCALEEVVMALELRRDYFGLKTTVKPQRLYPTSRLVASVTGVGVPRNKAVVGPNAFAQEPSSHQGEMLQRHSEYEIMRPGDVGMHGASPVLGRQSGRHALRERVGELGYHLGDLELGELFRDFQALAAKKEEIYDGDLEALIEARVLDAPGPWKILSVQTAAGTGTVPTATVCLQHTDGRRLQEAATGDGPIDAVLRAVERIVDLDVRLRDYRVRSVSVGKDAQGEVGVEVEYNGRIYRGRSASTDIVEASARSLVQVVNRILLENEPSAQAIFDSASRRD